MQQFSHGAFEFVSPDRCFTVYFLNVYLFVWQPSLLPIGRRVESGLCTLVLVLSGDGRATRGATVLAQCYAAFL